MKPNGGYQAFTAKFLQLLSMFNIFHRKLLGTKFSPFCKAHSDGACKGWRNGSSGKAPAQMVPACRIRCPRFDSKLNRVIAKIRCDAF
jgi:hypothetical protein